MTSEKDYIAIAKSLAAQRGRPEQAVRYTLDALAEDLAEYFAADNPRFSRTAFLQAAGVSNGRST